MEKTTKTPTVSTQAKARAIRLTTGNLTYDARLRTLHMANAWSPDPLRVKLVADLFHNSKRYISSNKVLRNALGSKARQKTSIVETRICGIRKKISKVGAATTIKAIRYRVYAIG